MARFPASLALCAALLLGVGAAAASHRGQVQSVAGVQKVIHMLTDMSAKAKQEKAEEEVAFATFSTWCSEESTNTKGEIGRNKEEIESLTADIGKLESEASQLGKSIGELQADVSTYEADKKAATAQRQKDNKAFLAEAQDYSESIDALDRAIMVMQKQDYDRTGSALLQLSERDQIPSKAKAVIAAFLGMMEGDKQEPMSYSAPEANAYEFQSGGIVQMLKKLKDDFRAKLAECQKEEMNSKHAYDMIVNDLTDSIENSNKDIGEKSVVKLHKQEKAGIGKKNHASTSALLEQNENVLRDMVTECSEKKLSFEEKQKLRTEEIEAINKAVEILSSPEVSANADKYLSLAQSRPAATALMQMGERRSAGLSEGFHRRLREFLEGEGERLHSQRLGLLAQKMRADPFAKVKTMIDDMLTRLLEEAHADADHEGFCDTEVGKSKVTRNKLSEDIDALSAAVEDGKATILALTEGTSALSSEVAELTKSIAEATAMRKDEKAKNLETIKDAKGAQVAVDQATAVLKDFYAKAMTATALLQAPSPRQWGLKTGVKMGSEEWNSLANPALDGSVDTGHKEDMQTFGATYKGQQDEAQNGVLALLEVIQSDFANLEADTSASEEESQRSYDTFMAESAKSKAIKEKKIEMNGADKTAAQLKLQEDIASLKATQDELLAADRYYDKLVPQCFDKGMTFEGRTKARAEEIASLKEALKILNSEDIATTAL